MNTHAIHQLSREAWSHAMLLRLAGATLLPRVEVVPIPAPAPPETLPPETSPQPAESDSDAPAALVGVAPGDSHPDRDERLQRLAAEVAECTRCPLSECRTQTVFADGSPDADIMFVGEGPGAEEDRQGVPFVGRAGQLLTKIIEAMGFRRDEVYIANIVKCRPPGNRTPDGEEMAACMAFLRQQLDLVRPRVIVLLGGTATRGLLGSQTGITRLRGRWTDWMGIPVMPTFHPSYLLRLTGQEQRAAKRQVWEDVQAARDRARGAPGADR